MPLSPAFKKTTLFLCLVFLSTPASALDKSFDAEHAWILQQPVDHYTIQAFAITDEARARTLVASLGLDESMVLFRSRGGSGMLYKGIYRSYDSRTSAQQGIHDLRRQFPDQSFWLRRFGDVAQEIRAGERQRAGYDQGYPPVLERTRAEKERTSYGQAFRLGQSAFNKQDYASALSWWTPLAQNGDAEAQYGLGFMYESGWGVEQDYGKAHSWYLRAANQGHAKSQFNLGVLYAMGRGVEQDDLIGRYWIRASAMNDDPRALEYIANGVSRK